MQNPLLNILGETHEVRIEVDPNYKTASVFTAVHAETGMVLCRFAAWHMYGGPTLYHIVGVSMGGLGDATLIVGSAPTDDGDADV